MKRLFLVTGLGFCFFIFFSLSKAQTAFAGTCIWTGTSNSNWDNSANWSGDCSGGSGQAGNTDDLVFPNAASNKTMNNDIASLSPTSMTFTGDNYVLNGNTILLNGNIITDPENPTINTALTLQTDIAIETGIYTGDINLNSHNITFTAGDPRIEVHGVISGSGNIIVQGPYLANFYGLNTFTGDITVQNFGTFNANSNSAAGNSNNLINILSNSYFAIAGGHNIPNDINMADGTGVASYDTGNEISGNIIGPDDGIIYFFPSGSDTLTVSGTITVNIMAKNSDGGLIIAGSGSNDVENLLIQSGSVTLSKTSGTAVNNYVQVGQGSSGGTIYLYQTLDNQIADSASVTVTSDGVWSLAGHNEQVSTVTLNSGTIDTVDGDLVVDNITSTDGGLIDSGTGEITLNGNMQMETTATAFLNIRGARLNLEADNTSMTVAEGDYGVIAIELPIYGTGDISTFGVLISVSADNSNFTGDILIGDADTPSMLGIQETNFGLGDSVGKTVIADGSTLFFNDTSGITQEPIEVAGDGLGETIDTDLGAIHGGNTIENQLTGTIILLADSRFTTDNGALVIYSDISGDFDVTIEGGEDSTGVVFAGTNTFAGTTTVINNILYLAEGNAIRDGEAIIMQGDSQLIVTDSETTGPISGDGVIVIDDDVYLISAYFGGTSTFSGQIVGTGNIIKYGAGELILSGNSPDFTGILYNSEGKITVNGNISASVDRLQGGTWAGTGTLGNTIAENGQISPGASPGILNITNNLEMNSLDTLNIELNGATVGSGYDQVNVIGTGNVSINSAHLNVSLGYNPTDNTRYTILKTTGTITGTFTGLPNLSTLTVGDKEMIIEYKQKTVELYIPATLNNPIFTASPSNASFGDSITLNIFWTGSGPIPTGSVTFKEGTTVLGTQSLSSGQASLILNSLPAGIHLFHATYSGDDVYDPATSGTISVTINPLSASTPLSLGSLDVVLEEIAAPESEEIEEDNEFYRLAVIVKDTSGNPIANALVTLEPGGFSGYTNRLGKYEFLQLSPGKYNLTVEYDGKTFEQDTSLSGDDRITFTISLDDADDETKGNSQNIPVWLIIAMIVLICVAGINFLHKQKALV